MCVHTLTALAGGSQNPRSWQVSRSPGTQRSVAKGQIFAHFCLEPWICPDAFLIKSQPAVDPISGFQVLRTYQQALQVRVQHPRKSGQLCLQGKLLPQRQHFRRCLWTRAERDLPKPVLASYVIFRASLGLRSLQTTCLGGEKNPQTCFTGFVLEEEQA